MIFLVVKGLSPRKKNVKIGKIKYESAKNIIRADHVLLKYSTKYCQE